MSEQRYQFHIPAIKKGKTIVYHGAYQFSMPEGQFLHALSISLFFSLRTAQHWEQSFKSFIPSEHYGTPVYLYCSSHKFFLFFSPVMRVILPTILSKELRFFMYYLKEKKNAFANSVLTKTMLTCYRLRLQLRRKRLGLS